MDKMFCAYCGKENPATAKFCLSCGKELTPHLGRMNVLLLILFSIITLGIYIPIWFLVKREAINSLASTEKLGSGAPIFVLLVYVTDAMLIFVPLGVTEVYLDIISNLITVIGVSIVVILSFKVRHIFDEHFNLKQQRNIKLSGVATFFFTIYYLQYKINCIEKEKTAEYTIYVPWMRGISVLFGAFAVMSVITSGWKAYSESGLLLVLFCELFWITDGFCLLLLGLFPDAVCSKLKIDTKNKYKAVVIILMVAWFVITVIEFNIVKEIGMIH